MKKFNNTITVRLTDKESDYLIELMNEKFELDNISDAIRYCIRQEMEKTRTWNIVLIFLQ